MVSVKPCEKTECPSQDALTVLLNNDADPASRDDVAEHVGSCSTCQARLESMAVGTEGELADVVRGMGEAEPPANSAYWKALDQAEEALTDGFPDAEIGRAHV